MSCWVAEPLGPLEAPCEAELQELSFKYQQNQTCWTLSRRHGKKARNYTEKFVGIGKIPPIPHTWQSAFPSATQETQQLNAGRH